MDDESGESTDEDDVAEERKTESHVGMTWISNLMKNILICLV